MRTARGLSLLETLITLALLASVLGMVAMLAGQYARLLEQQDSHGQAAFKLGIVNQVADELSQALEIYRPATDGAEVSSAHIIKVNQGQVILGPRALLPNGRADVWYSLANNNLVRTVYFDDGTTYAAPVAHDMTWFAVKRVSERQYVVNTSFLAGDQVQQGLVQFYWGVR